MNDAMPISDGARTIAALMPALPEQVVRDLHQLLVERLGHPTSATLRELRLGLLIDLIATTNGEIPTTDDYETERARRAEQGEPWPSASTLAHGYNSWAKVVRAAMLLHHNGTWVRVPRAYAHSRQSASYSREEIVRTLLRFRRQHGCWPMYSEFFEWAADLRRLARTTGALSPRIPSHHQIKHLFGGFTQALRAANVAYDQQNSDA